MSKNKLNFEHVDVSPDFKHIYQPEDVARWISEAEQVLDAAHGKRLADVLARLQTPASSEPVVKLADVKSIIEKMFDENSERLVYPAALTEIKNRVEALITYGGENG